MSAGSDRVAEILAAWRAAAERGERAEPADVIRRHPEHEAGLRRGFAALALLDRAVADAGASTDSGGSGLPAANGAVLATTRIGDFQLLREVGRGAMGVVYEAEQVSMRRRVALKVLYPSVTLHAKAIERFQREARAAGKLHHTNIVSVYGMGSEGGTWFYAMEWIEGRPLSQALADRRRLEGVDGDDKPADPSTAIGISTGNGRREEFARVARAFAGLADALELAHAAGVVHRDVKPSNILLDGAGTLKLLDFGLARSRDEDASMTATGEVVGTPQYMSPEQARGTAVDAQTDVYSLGATLYEVLTARPPVEGKDVADVLRRILSNDPPSPRAFDRRIPRDLETIVLKAMEKEPGRRYRTAADLARDLTLFAEGAAIRARRIGVVGRAWRGVKRHRLRTTLVAAVVVLAAATTALAIRHAAQEERRVALEYEALLEEAAGLVGRRALTGTMSTNLSDEDGDRCREMLARAAAMVPDRPEAYFMLWQRGPLSPGLARLEEAKARGLNDRIYHLARAHTFHHQGMSEESASEMSLARSASGTESPRAAVMEASLLLGFGKRDEAIRCVTGALSAPGLTRRIALRIRATARESGGDLEGAIEDLSALREENALIAAGLDVHVGALWHRLGRTDRAQALFDRGLSRAKTDASVIVWAELASVCESEGQRAWLDVVFREALAASPNSFDLWRLRSDDLARLHENREALHCADEAVRLKPDSPLCHATRSRALYNLKRIEESAEEIRRAQQLDPDSPVIAATAAAVLAKLGKLDDAMSEFKRLALRFPYELNVWANMGEVGLMRGGWQDPDALMAFERAIELEPQCVPARARRLSILIDRNLLDEAIKDADAGIALVPRDAASPLYVAKARALRRAARLAESLSMCERAIAIGSRDYMLSLADAYHVKSLVLGDLGRDEESLAATTRAMELVPPNHPWRDARSNRISTLQKLGRVEEALAEADAAIEKDPAALWHTLRGNALSGLSRSREALEAYDRALALDSSEAARQPYRSICLLQMGRFADALRLIEAESVDDRSREVRRALALVGLKRVEDARRVVDSLGRQYSDDRDVSLQRAGILRRLGAAADARQVAVDAIARAPPVPGGSESLLAAYAGDLDLARRLMPAGQPDASTRPDDAYTRACVFAILGDRDAAFRWLESAADKGMRLGALDVDDPDLASLADDPRLAPLVERMRIR